MIRRVYSFIYRLFFTLTITILFSGIAHAGSGPVSIILDGKEIISDSPPVIVNGRTLVPARAVFEAMGGSVEWNAASREVTVEVDSVTVILKINSKKAYIDGTEKTMDVPAGIIRDRTMIPIRFVSEAAGCKVTWDEKNRIVGIVSPDSVDATVPAEEQDFEPIEEEPGDEITEEDQAILDRYGLTAIWKEARNKLVVIDAGHGGADTGSRGYEYGIAVLNEKDVNLDVALRLQEMLEAAGVRIYMIRTGDVTIPLYERQDTANSLEASLYVAIHNNSYTNSTPRGTEVHYRAKYDPTIDGISAMDLAKRLQNTLTANLGLPSRGTKVSPELAVLRRTVMPAVIIEGAFVSNPEDLNYIKTDEFREKYAMSTAKCIIDVLNDSVHR